MALLQDTRGGEKGKVEGKTTPNQDQGGSKKGVFWGKKKKKFKNKPMTCRRCHKKGSLAKDNREGF